MSQKIILVLLVCLSIFSRVCAQVVIDDKSNRISIGKELWLLQTNKTLSIDEVVSSQGFRRSADQVPNLGVGSAGTEVWAKFTLVNKSSNPELFLELAYPLLDQVDLYTPDTRGFKRSSSGQGVPFGERKYNHPNYIFDISVPANQSKTFYIRVNSSEPVILPITVNRAQTLWERLTLETFLVGIFIGIVVIMIAYNLFIFFSMKDESYLYYVIYVAFLGLTQVGIKGYTFQYLWPQLPGFELSGVILFSSLGCIAGLLFSISFLKLIFNAPRTYQAHKFVIAFLTVAVFLTIVGRKDLGFQFMHLGTSATIALILFSAYKRMAEGFTPARCFFLGWLFFTIGSSVFLLKDYSALPYTILTSYAVISGAVIKMAFLSFGLATRIKVLKADKDKFQEEALKTAYQNERMIREQNIMLEQMVKTRTSELNNANHELSSTLNNLQIAQNQLLESEKMASLGFLSRSIAHEINNPINFITSNVAPLKRDVKILYDFMDYLEKMNYSKLSVSEKKLHIMEYKEDIDMEYLRTEIDNMFNAMSEGASRTVKILDGLRIFSKVYENDLRKANINDGIDSTLLLLNNLLNRIRIEKNYAQLPLVQCYPGKLNQVFLNIIINAAQAINSKFGKEEGGIISISTSYRGAKVIVSIRDNGTGMEESIARQVFEPFFTTREYSGGAGLGMSIAYHTVRKHQGNIHLNSKPGEGTEFTVELRVDHLVP